MYRRVLMATTIALVLNGCTVVASKNINNQVVLASDTKFTYSGRGAGAGVALMSTMGPVGIAVGVAIDEGIRKDLEASAESVGFDIGALVSDELTKVPNSIDTLTIIEFGMKDIRGSDDLMAPYVIFQMSADDAATTLNGVTHYESGFLDAAYPLAEYKENGNFIVESFSELIREQLGCSISNECGS
jgi:hypothetical protein